MHAFALCVLHEQLDAVPVRAFAALHTTFATHLLMPRFSHLGFAEWTVLACLACTRPQTMASQDCPEHMIFIQRPKNLACHHYGLGAQRLGMAELPTRVWLAI